MILINRSLLQCIINTYLGNGQRLLIHKPYYPSKIMTHSTHRHTVAAWRSGNIVGCINEVTLRRARLVLGLTTVFGG